jgi:chaperonin GroEL (HSP60 family)
LLTSAVNLNAEEKIKHYEQALKYVKNTDEKKQILAGIGMF